MRWLLGLPLNQISALSTSAQFSQQVNKLFVQLQAGRWPLLTLQTIAQSSLREEGMRAPGLVNVPLTGLQVAPWGPGPQTSYSSWPLVFFFNF